MNTQAPRQFANRFWLLWGSQAVSLAGSYAVQFAIIWWLTSSTGSATVLASAALVGLVPQVLLGPFFGALIDRCNRKRIMLASDLLIALASAWLAWMFYIDAASIAHVFIVLGIRAIGGALHGPAMLASTSLMVPEEHYVRVQGLNQALQNGSPLLAAPLGALLVTWLPMSAVMLLDVVTALIAVVPLVFVKVPQPDKHPQATEHSSALAEVIAGIRYLRQHREQIYLVLFAALANFFVVPGFVLLPLFVMQELGGGAYYLSVLQLVFGVGGVVGGSLLAAWGGFQRRAYTVILGFACVGAATLLIGVAQPATQLLPAAAMFLIGAAAAMINGAIMAILQSQVDANYQGRMFTLLGSIAGAITPLALLLAAPIAELLGIRFWYLAGGASCLVVAAVAAFIPAITAMEGRPRGRTIEDR